MSDLPRRCCAYAEFRPGINIPSRPPPRQLANCLWPLGAVRDWWSTRAREVDKHRLPYACVIACARNGSGSRRLRAPRPPGGMLVTQKRVRGRPRKLRLRLSLCKSRL